MQTDGQLKTGRDVVVAALLGADEMGFATAPLVASGCVMMRACHLNTCPVGIATQDPELRRRFPGPARARRQLLLLRGRGDAPQSWRGSAYAGSTTWSDASICSKRTTQSITGRHAASTCRTSCASPTWRRGTPLRRVRAQESPLADALDWQLIEARAPALEEALPVTARICDSQRQPHGRWPAVAQGERRPTAPKACRPAPFRLALSGSAGQSFGAWLAPGIELALVGDANDYVGKGLSGGGSRSPRPPEATFAAEENVIIGNTVLYGATSGRAFFRGLAGERFAVRNSGASAVVEGVGDHGCEYMTGGIVVVLGPTGRNFAVGHERRHRLRARRARARSSGGATWSSSASTRWTTTMSRHSGRWSPSTVERNGLGCRCAPARRLGGGAGPLRQGDAARLPSGRSQTLPIERDDRTVSTGGDGFVTTETEGEAAA